MTAIASPPAALFAKALPRSRSTLAHRRLETQLVPLDSPDYSPATLVTAIAEFCRARRKRGASPAQVLSECMALAASRLDGAGTRLVEVLARQSTVCPLTEELDRRA